MIKSERLQLKPISLDYKDEIFQEFTPEITLYMFPKPAEKIEETVEFINKAMKENEEGSNLQLVVLDKETEEFLGCCGLHKINTKTPELGIWLKKSAHGRGFGKEAIIALKKWADENLDYEYLLYPVEDQNIASKKITEFLGGKIAREYEKINLSGRDQHILEYRIYAEKT